jgi:hypothetical protein
VLCKRAMCQLCEIARRAPDSQLCDTAGQSMPDNSKLPSLPCLRLHELVAPTLVTHSWVGSRANCSVPLVDSKDDKAGHLIELVRIQTVTRREARKAT